ncbi:MAG: hypothetical protein BJ554DRAFT_2568 [Olpidium bornovanus]|uniref:Uncharacterized protein n=1 Tax=Olpidium bornovanus TaxID=278681 RepID=A0A8H8A0L4_9FUNG|nr:MAG: hypothetical protein BJ554DRAFT_2568 [Olpidium bornovanus]
MSEDNRGRHAEVDARSLFSRLTAPTGSSATVAAAAISSALLLATGGAGALTRRRNVPSFPATSRSRCTAAGLCTSPW